MMIDCLPLVQDKMVGGSLPENEFMTALWCSHFEDKLYLRNGTLS